MSASPLTGPYASSTRLVDRDLRPVAAGVTCQQGGWAAMNASGFVKPAAGALGEIVVGRFTEQMANPGANGAVSVNIEYPRERYLILCDNDTTNPVVVASRERLCSVLDDHTATAQLDGLGDLGIVYDVTSEGVWIELALAGDAQAQGEPNLQAGSVTLVAGVATVNTGVAITAASKIIVTMGTPGGTQGVAYKVSAITPGKPGTGAFTVTAVSSTGTTVTTDTSTLNYLIVN